MRLIDADALTEKCGDWYVEEGTEEGFIGTVKQLIDAQPEQRWIPVTERLPEVGSCVLCFLSYPRYMGQYRVCKYRPADKYVDHPYFDFNENGFPNVVAWMPLPEPYQEGEQE